MRRVTANLRGRSWAKRGPDDSVQGADKKDECLCCVSLCEYVFDCLKVSVCIYTHRGRWPQVRNTFGYETSAVSLTPAFLIAKDHLSLGL